MSRTDIDAQDYFQQQKKKLEIADRRPVIRKASDLVGPNIGASATRVTDFNDLLATYSGFISSAPGALNAPNSTDAFIGTVVMDDLLAGRQSVTSITSGQVYTRLFIRGTSDPATLAWGAWQTSGGAVPACSTSGTPTTTNVASGGAATLSTLPPSLDTIGASGVFERTSNTRITIKKSGVYTGILYILGTSAIATATVIVYHPQGGAQTQITLPSAVLRPTVMVPFNFWTTNGTGFIELTVGSPSAAISTQITRVALSRIGDAA